MSRKGKSALTALCAAAAIVLGGATPAMAAPMSTQACSAPGTQTQTTQRGIHISKGAYRAYGQGGGTITITKGQTTTTTGTLQTTASVEAGVIFSKVSASVGVSVALSKAVTTTAGYSWTVPGTGQGWVEMGSYGYQIHWEKGHYNSPCTWVKTSQGDLSGTTSSPDFIHS
ncbi:hypothetical protein [uncultured Modestobacter sp.]|uniref:hypothetical protein n=1 Tax=uncultured Modestobacter sp. TaxID=380048 RepID=UPI002631409D|nr:hypothetical protein [uncultured Modestobacter sp.]